MLGVLGFAVLWLASAWWRWPRAATLGALGLWWLVLVLVTAPGLGGAVAGGWGEFRLWVLAGPVAVLALGYRAGLRALRSRAMRRAAPDGGAVPAPEADRPATFEPAEVERYARHILLHEIGGPGQQRLKAARVLVVGAGGLGAPVMMYLAGAGVGTIGVVDPDRVEPSNLQRQIIHTTARIGQSKVASSAEAIAALNPHIRVETHELRLEPANAAALIGAYDLVLDGSDNFDTRYLVNRVCAELARPLIAGAIARWEGQLSLYDPARGGPCYECVFPVRPAPGLVPSCAEAGVAAPLPGVIGAMMAMEAVKHLTGAGDTLRGRLLIQDSLYGESRVVALRPRPDCPVCGGGRPKV
ncbi:HesA/MoeB/ThiF family protein [Pseudogemmobacter sonorensis]|uniref:HesA/MoeB/ThiF family protein n=1 Tax=Pseudogemmobacter sonorensis TaxID=2989681 RepID=UPI00369EAFD5